MYHCLLPHNSTASLTNHRNASRRNGKPASCEPCRLNKTRCDHGMPKCDRCKQRGIEERCFYHPAPLTKPRNTTNDAGTGESRPLKRKYGYHVELQKFRLTELDDLRSKIRLSLHILPHPHHQTTSLRMRLPLMSTILVSLDLDLMRSFYLMLRSQKPLGSARYQSLQKGQIGN
jgi:hypothetical protein